MSGIDWRQRLSTAEFRVRNFIDGRYVDCVGSEVITKHSPRDGSLLYQFGAGDGSEVNQAVASAKAAFEDGRWSELPPSRRKAVLCKLADLVEQHKETFALNESLDVGKPISKALTQDIATAAYRLRSAGEKATGLFNPSGGHGGTFVYQARRPIGVVGGIVGWNFPLSLATSKVAPALATGNSLVLKPSEFTSLSAGLLAALAIEAGVPAGVLNVVHGAGATVGNALARHMDVKLLSFTGSSATGKYLMKAAGDSNMKRLILECGGKSPFIVFEDCPADLDYLATEIVATAFPNQGALCVAGSRLLLQEGIKDKLLPKILELTAQITPGDPLDPATSFGALINEAHMNKVLAYIESGKQEGARLICGGNRIRQETGGYYVEPTIFDQVDPNQKIAQEEIFGPLLSVFTFKDEAEAIKLANSTCYGLAAYAATENLGRAQRLARSLNAGVVSIIGTSTPSGEGVEIGTEPQQQSGFGVEHGLDGLLSHTVTTHVRVYS